MDSADYACEACRAATRRAILALRERLAREIAGEPPTLEDEPPQR
jgi:hypothetical protein